MDQASRRFAWLYALSQLKIRYRYTALGLLWNVLEPALYLGVLALVFSAVNRMPAREYTLYLFSGLVPWRYFDKTVMTCMDSLVQGDWLLKKLPVSPYALPLSRWLVGSVEFLVSFLVLAALLLVVKDRWTIHCVVLPLSALVWSAAALGVGLSAATLFTYFRDLKPLVQMGLMVAFFSAPILYKADLFAAGTPMHAVLAFHPLTYFAALFQAPIYHEAWPAASDWIVATGLAAGALALGRTLIERARPSLYFYL